MTQDDKATSRLTEAVAWIALAVLSMPVVTLTAIGCYWLWRGLT